MVNNGFDFTFWSRVKLFGFFNTIAYMFRKRNRRKRDVER